MKMTFYSDNSDHPTIRTGKWTVKWRDGGIFAWRDNSGVGHQIPAELVDGKPFYPFGIYRTVPKYAIEAMDKLTRKYGV